MAKNTDYIYLEEIKNLSKKFQENVKVLFKGHDRIEYPLSQDILDKIGQIQIRENDDDYTIFKYQDVLNKLWSKLISSAIIALRFFDKREPFMNAGMQKIPHAYGIDSLSKYFKKYTEFESVMYGGSKYYRDHLVHVFRVWLLGIDLLLKDNCKYLKDIKLPDDNDANDVEKISMWTIIALTHDLGYPLEKALSIIDRTKDMMSLFVVNPVMTIDLSFNGVQNSMNDYILRLISSKMRIKEDKYEDKKENKAKKDKNEDKKEEDRNEDEEDKKDDKEKAYVVRLQSKYYFKFQKSLEHNKHGILSTIIIYKLLLYFLESDFSMNEDYAFSEEDSRQFYIRREILRAIASHTCHDVYQLDATTFSFFLILCDDAQEWGRKYISELYIDKSSEYTLCGVKIYNENDLYKISLNDKYTVPEDYDFRSSVIKRFISQSLDYRDIFRDGQDTEQRNFEFTRKTEIEVNKAVNASYQLSLIISTKDQTKVVITKDNGISDLSGEMDKINEDFKDVGIIRQSEDNKRIEVLL